MLQVLKRYVNNKSYFSTVGLDPTKKRSESAFVSLFRVIRPKWKVIFKATIVWLSYEQNMVQNMCIIQPPKYYLYYSTKPKHGFQQSCQNFSLETRMKHSVIPRIAPSTLSQLLHWNQNSNFYCTVCMRYCTDWFMILHELVHAFSDFRELSQTNSCSISESLLHFISFLTLCIVADFSGNLCMDSFVL